VIKEGVNLQTAETMILVPMGKMYPVNLAAIYDSLITAEG